MTSSRQTTFLSSLRPVLLAGATLLIAFAANLRPPGADAAPIDADRKGSCTAAECHPMPSAADGAIAHTPFLEEQCSACHGTHADGGAGLLKTEEPGLCLACHTGVELADGAMAHPAGQGNCTSCHNPHRSNVRNLLRTDDHRRGCVGCHAEDLAREHAKPHHHRYFDPETECGSCHYAHGNSGDRFLRPNLGETCLTCHDMPIQVEGRKLENVGLELRHARSVHKPAESALCQSCHTPHGSLQPSLLKDSYPAGSYTQYRRENYGLCWQCHNPESVESADTVAATRFRNGSTNLHNLHVVRFGKGRACHLCHAPHAAERPHLLRSSVRFGSWDGPMEFEARADGGRCATACHRPKEYRR